MIALVRRVIRRFTDSGSMHALNALTSAKTGRAMHATAAYGVAANVIAGTITSSPGPMPKALSATSSALVPEVVGIAKRAPWQAAKADANSAALRLGLG